MILINHKVLLFCCDKQRHLICVPYSVANLHEMAKQLGIKRHWFHKGRFPHYDIPKKRLGEISSKCIVISSKELLELIKEGLAHRKVRSSRKRVLI